MKKLLPIIFLFIAAMPAYSQIQPLRWTPPGGNKKASVSEQIGVVQIAISYNRPGVKGREGNIYNTPVAHYGFSDL